ncbi:MAG: hypothetical protein Q9186_003664 [Xanthomendoza sp. 1 TL-2023]
MGMFEDCLVAKSPKSMDRLASGRPCSRGLQAACNALVAGGSVVWIDASYTVNGRHLMNLLDDFLQASKGSIQGQDSKAASGEMLNKFHHFIAPTLPHLMALLIHSTATFPPEDATLLVVDSISTPFNHAFAQSSRYVEDRVSGKKNDVAQWASGRRWAVMGDLISAFGKLAATRNMAIVLTGQTTTKTKLENAAQLQPAMSGTTWDSGISSRILLYRDWQEEIDEKSIQKQGDGLSGLRFAAAIKNGIHEVEMACTAFSKPKPAVPLQAVLKRKRDEVADSASDSGDEVSSDDGFSLVADNALAEK